LARRAITFIEIAGNRAQREPTTAASMRNRFDHLGKQIGQAALGRSGPTEAQAEISPETQYADLRHDPDPARIAGRTSLGLLGRIASSPCLIEIYARAPDAAEFRACLGKHLAHWQRHARDARSLKQPQAALVEPSLWIIAAGTPASVVAELGLKLADGWPEGVYLFGGAVLRVGLVAANQLPRPDRSTLLVRLMAAGPLLRQAVEELRDLPADADERAIAGPILLGSKHTLGTKPTRTREEEEVIVAVQDFFEAARAEGRAQAVLTVLRVRGIPVPDAARERILTEQDADRLERWLERAVVAGSLTAVLHEPS
jgi:hypothetical protein